MLTLLRLRAGEPGRRAVLPRLRRAARHRRAAARGAEGRHRALRRPRRLHVARGAARPGGRPRGARAVLGAAAQRARALRRHGREVHRRRGDGALRRARSRTRTTRSAPSARRSRSATGRAKRTDLQVRIAVTTGEALVLLGARPGEGEGMAAGDVVNTAARLQSAAPVNGVLVGETTYRATRDAIEYAEREPVDGEGQGGADPRVGGGRQARSRLGMDLEQRDGAPLVGRVRELESLVGAFERARGEREPQLVTLVGVPGIGKSRLVAELFARLDAIARPRVVAAGPRAAVRRRRQLLGARRDGEGAGGHPGERLRWRWRARSCGRASRAPSPTSERDVGRRSTCCRSSAANSSTRPGAGTRASRRGAAIFEGARRAAPARARLRGSALGRRRPARLRRPSRRLGDRRAAARRRHCAAGAARPAARLGRREAERDDACADAARGRRDGADHPRRPRSRRCCRPTHSRRCSSAPAAIRCTPSSSRASTWSAARRDDLPETIQGIIAARLDGLGADEKRLLQDAAVLGKVFWAGAAAELAELDGAARAGAARARAQGARAARAALVGRRRGRVRVPARARARRRLRPDPACRARREAQPSRPRGSNVSAAPTITPSSSLITTRRRSSSARAAGGIADGLADRARVAFRQAGDRALRLSAFPAAERFYADALAMWPDDAERPHVLFAACTRSVPRGRRGRRAARGARRARGRGRRRGRSRGGRARRACGVARRPSRAMRRRSLARSRAPARGAAAVARARRGARGVRASRRVRRATRRGWKRRALRALELAEAFEPRRAEASATEHAQRRRIDAWRSAEVARASTSR